MIRIPLLVLCMSSLLFAQTSPALVKQARIDIAYLTGEELGGRGYQQEGHLKAANWLKEQFQEIGLAPVQGSYLQAFGFEVNVAQKAQISVNGKTLQTGTGFIVQAESGSGNISGKPKNIQHGLKIKPNLAGKVVVLRAGLPDKIQQDPAKRAEYAVAGRDDTKLAALTQIRPAAVILLKQKLTASLRPQALPFPIIEAQVDSFPKKVKEISLDIKTGVQDIQTHNVLGYLKGNSESDSVIVLTAHYDHLGNYSGARFAGANDNASGIAALLALARHFSQKENRPAHNLLFIAFGAEEAGLQGSAHYVYKDARIRLDKMKFLLNLDLMGNGDEGIMAVGGKDFPAAFAQLQATNDSLQAVPKVRARPNAPNSDHYFFLKEGVPGFFIYTLGGPPHYHDVRDTADNLLLSRFSEVTHLLIRFVKEL